jgi:DNA-directed RNA polymerase specialized sigma24 family protein
MNGNWTKDPEGRDRFFSEASLDLMQTARSHGHRYGQPDSFEDYAQDGAVRILEAMDDHSPPESFKATLEAATPEEAVDRARDSHLLKEVTRNPARAEKRKRKGRVSLADVPEPSISVPQDKHRELTQFLERVFVDVIRPAGLSNRRYFAAVMEIARICGASDLDDDLLAEVAEAAGVLIQDLRRYVEAKAVEPPDRKAWERAKADLRNVPKLRGAIVGLGLLAILVLTTWLEGTLGVGLGRDVSEMVASHQWSVPYNPSQPLVLPEGPLSIHQKA